MSIAGVKSNTIIKKGQVDMDNKINNRVPHCVHQSVVEALDRLESQPYNKAYRYNGARKVLLIAACCVIAVIFMTGAAMFLTDRQLIEKREKEFVDPYAEVLMESTSDNGITMTINKVAQDYYMTYVFFTLKNENGVFEKRPEFDEIGETTPAAYRVVESFYGSPKGFTALSSSDYDPENPTDTIHAVLRANLYVCEKVKLDFKKLRSYDGEITYADGFSFDITVGVNEKVFYDAYKDVGIDEEELEKELNRWDKKAEVLDYLLLKPKKSIKIEDCKLKVSQIYISPYQIKVVLEDDMSKTVKIGELEYYPVTLTTISSGYYRYRHELIHPQDEDSQLPRSGILSGYYSIGDSRTKYDIDLNNERLNLQFRTLEEYGPAGAQEAFDRLSGGKCYEFSMTEKGKEVAKITDDPAYWELMDNVCYRLGVEFSQESEAKIINNCSVGSMGDSPHKTLPKNKKDWRLSEAIDLYIDRPVSIDEIERIYFYKYSDPSVQVDVWVNK